MFYLFINKVKLDQELSLLLYKFGKGLQNFDLQFLMQRFQVIFDKGHCRKNKSYAAIFLSWNCLLKTSM